MANTTTNTDLYATLAADMLADCHKGKARMWPPPGATTASLADALAAEGGWLARVLATLAMLGKRAWVRTGEPVLAVGGVGVKIGVGLDAGRPDVFVHYRRGTTVRLYCNNIWVRDRGTTGSRTDRVLATLRELGHDTDVVAHSAGACMALVVALGTEPSDTAEARVAAGLADVYEAIGQPAIARGLRLVHCEPERVSCTKPTATTEPERVSCTKPATEPTTEPTTEPATEPTATHCSKKARRQAHV